MFNRMVDFLAHYRAIPTLLGIALILINLVFQFFPGLGWVRESQLLLNLGVLLGLGGILLAHTL
jgi:low affinity Fe/Cu permease